MQLPKYLKYSFVGFTLIELVIAISIVAIISAVGLVSYSRAQLIARDAKRKQDLRSIAIALELFYQKNKHFPCSDWQFSYPASNNWISDTCAAPITYLSPTYISQVPVDPMNTGINPSSGNAYSYAYWSGNWGSCQQGQNFIMLTLLENSDDPDSYGKKKDTVCGVPYGSWGISDKSFALYN